MNREDRERKNKKRENREREDDYADIERADELEKRRTEGQAEETPSQNDCFLNVTPDSSVIDMMKNILDKFHSIKWFFQKDELPLKNTFISPPAIQATVKAAIQEGISPAAIQAMPVFLISLHGGLPVLRKNKPNLKFSYNYKTFIAKSFFTRLIKTPNGCCSFIRPDVRQQYFDAVTGILKSSSVTQQSIESIKQLLRSLSFDLEQDFCSPLKRTTTISGSIFECRSRAFETVNTGRGDTVINKLWTADVYEQNDEFKDNHNLNPRGILFCNDVVITLPNNWAPSRYDISDFSSDYDVADVNDDNSIGVYTFKRKFDSYKGLPDYDSHEYQATYQIGVYTPGTPGTSVAIGTPGKIYYRAGTNLLSCPYFMQFASERLGRDIINLNNSLSLGQGNKLLIPMAIEITAEILYWYLYNQRFLSIDMSCEALMIYDMEGKYIKPEARIQLKTPEYYDELQKLYNVATPGSKRIRGGITKKYKPKKRCNTKKYKTKRYKKRGDPKKHKTKNIENNKIK